MFRFLFIIFLILCQIFKYESFSKLKDCTNNVCNHFLFNGLLNAFYKGKQTNEQKRSLLLTKTSFWILTAMIAHDIKALFLSKFMVPEQKLCDETQYVEF